MNKTIKVRNLFKVSPIHIFNNMTGPHQVEFEDGIVETIDASEIVLSRYYWQLAYNHDIRIVSPMRLSNFYENGFYGSNTHKDFFAYVYKVYVQEYLKPSNRLTFENLEMSWKTMYMIVNQLYSELQYHILDYSVSLSILDYIDLQKDKELLTLIDNAMKDKLNPKHIEYVNDRIKVLMAEKPDNNLSKLYNCGAANRTQISHSIGLRGFVTDINNMIYSELVGKNLTLGLDGFYDLACESAVMGKALKLQEFGVRYSEWLQRELHLVSMHIKSLTLDDCGNRYYHDWIIKDLTELIQLEGSNVLIDGQEVELDIKLHKDKVGKVLKIRRINDCKHLKHGHICSKCLGAMSYTIPSFASPAHALISVLMSAIGQLMLSAKHYTDSSSLKILKLNGAAAKYLTLKESDYYLKQDIDKTKKYSIVLNNESYYGFRLLSSSMTEKIDNLDTSKLSIIDKLYMVIDDGKNPIREYIEIKQDGRCGILDQAFIIHSLTNTTINSNGDYIIDVTNYNGRILYLENKEFAFDQFNSEFKTLLKSVGQKKRISPDKMIIDIFNYLNKKLPINIKIVEMLVASITVEDMDNKDYSVGLNRDTRTVTSYGNAIGLRSVGIDLGFEEQKKVINTPTNFIARSNPYNPLENVWNIKNIKWTTKQ